MTPKTPVNPTTPAVEPPERARDGAKGRRTSGALPRLTARKSDTRFEHPRGADLTSADIMAGPGSSQESTSGLPNRSAKKGGSAERGPAQANERRHAVGLLAARHLTLLFLAAVIVRSPELLGQRPALLAGVAFDLIVFGTVAHVGLIRAGRPPRLLPIIEAAMLVGAVAAAPTLLPYAVVVACGHLAIGAAIYGVTASTVAALFALAGFIGALLARDVSLPWAMLGIFAAFVPGTWFAHRRLLRFERETSRQYQELLEGLDAAVWEGRPGGRRLTYLSDRARDMFGTDPAELIAKWQHFVHPDDLASDEAALAAASVNESSFTVDLRVCHADGHTVYVRDTIRVERDEHGKPVRLRGVMVDVSRQQEAESLIRRQAQHDVLTGLPNRLTFNDELRRRLDSVHAKGDGLALLLMDLNGFKEVNDALGHAVGDQLLQAISGRLSAYVPDQAMVARLGGNEFAVLLSPATARTATALADTVAACLQPPFIIDDMTIQSSAATGIALYPNDGDTPGALLKRADVAMYEAKQAGRAHVFAKPDEDKDAGRRMQLLGELRSSIATGEFQLFHQPKIDLRTGRVVGTEGLIRWQHKQFGLLTPHEFLELSELSGLIQPLTRWIIEVGIGQARRWRDEGFDLTVALNLSARNFFDQGLPSLIAGLLADNDLPGEALVVEITEREVMADRALARSALTAFRALGVRISVDDFGTGYSSLSQLQQLPIDEIKIDQSFVAGMVKNNPDAVIVRSIIELGYNLGLEVVAEGVEELDQLRALRQLGCDRAQGFAISKPIPADQFTDWLRDRSRTTRTVPATAG